MRQCDAGHRCIRRQRRLDNLQLVLDREMTALRLLALSTRFDFRPGLTAHFPYQPVAEMPFSRPTYFADPSWRFTPRVLPDLPKRRN
jgi:hypothetical protein